MGRCFLAQKGISSKDASVRVTAGHTVHGTVRRLDNKSALQHLLSLPHASSRLKLFEADLLEPESFDIAVAGATVVVHTASPFTHKVKRSQAQSLIDTAVRGTANVIGAALKDPLHSA